MKIQATHTEIFEDGFNPSRHHAPFYTDENLRAIARLSLLLESKQDLLNDLKNMNNEAEKIVLTFENTPT